MRERLTPELTRRARAAHSIMGQDDDESHAIEASGSMSCSPADVIKNSSEKRDSSKAMK
jgi:hypothetical protein